MKRILLIVTLLITNIFALSTAQVVEKAEPMTFRVVVPLSGSTASTGTGFIINKDGYLITNNHVVEGHRGKIFVKNKFDTYQNVKLIKTYPKRDIAILKIENYNKGIFFKLQDPDSIKKGEMIFPLGFPGAADILEGLSFNASLSQGIISKITHDNSGFFINNYTLIQIDAVINHGNSGGPLLNKHASVVGINTLGNGADGVQGIFWSIHVKELIKTLKENNIDYTIDNESMEVKDKTQTIWYVLGLLGFVILVVIVIVLKRKNITTQVDEREISKLVKDKILKYTPKDDIKDKAIQKEKSEQTRMMTLSLIPYNSKLPEINNIKKQELIVGRSTGCDVLIDHNSISKKHVKIILKGDTIEIIDLGSTNGTYINGKKLITNKSYILNDFEELMIGSEEVIYTKKGMKNTKLLLMSKNGSFPNITKSGILGRSDECDIIVNNSNVSRKHLKIEVTNAEVYITDLGSANGTYVDGKKLKVHQKVKLSKGMNVVIGSEEVVYEYNNL